MNQRLGVRGGGVDAERGEVGEDPAGEGAVDFGGEEAEGLGLRVAGRGIAVSALLVRQSIHSAWRFALASGG